MINSSLLLRLREATTDLHKRVETSVDFRRSFASRDAYEHLLQRLYGFYSPFERTIEVWDVPKLRLELASRRKSPLLEADLRVTGATPGSTASFAGCSGLPVIRSHANAIGALYVVEGATLGGEVIARILEKQLGVTAAAGGSFFASYGTRVREMWAVFGEAATRYCDTDAKCDQAVDGAVATFESFARWMHRERDTRRRPASIAGLSRAAHSSE